MLTPMPLVDQFACALGAIALTVWALWRADLIGGAW